MASLGSESDFPAYVFSSPPLGQRGGCAVRARASAYRPSPHRSPCRTSEAGGRCSSAAATSPLKQGDDLLTATPVKSSRKGSASWRSPTPSPIRVRDCKSVRSPAARSRCEEATPLHTPQRGRGRSPARRCPSSCGGASERKVADSPRSFAGDAESKSSHACGPTNAAAAVCSPEHRDLWDEAAEARTTVCVAAGCVLSSEGNIELEACPNGHALCGHCLRKRVRAALRRGDASSVLWRCPCGRGALAQHEVRQVTTDEEFDRFLEQTLQLCKRNATTCPVSTCGAVLHVEMAPREQLARAVSSALQAKASDNDGRPLSAVAVAHRERHRVRCGACGDDHCHRCRSTPYHLGYTCEEHAERSSRPSCRFCSGDAIVVARPGAAAKGADGRRRARSVVEPPNCGASECRSRAAASCQRMLRCGHHCGGVRGESRSSCPPCMNNECKDWAEGDADGDDYCAICWTEPLNAAPVVKLKSCGHTFHAHCLRARIAVKWDSAEINFSCLGCPLCQVIVDAPAIKDDVAALLALRLEVLSMAARRAREEKMFGDDEGKDGKAEEEHSQLNQEEDCEALGERALRQLNYYQCSRCLRPYFGGRRQCEPADGGGAAAVGAHDDPVAAAEAAGAGNIGASFDRSQLVCGACSSVSIAGEKRRPVCAEHGSDGIAFKCKFCCNLASWFCWGTTHFCQSCHDRQMKGEALSQKPPSAMPKCVGVEKCVARGQHPPNGTTEHSLGCGLCRTAF